MKRYLERPTNDYSVHALVDELRLEARSSWSVMHSFRKQAIEQPERKCDFERMELGVRRQLAFTLSILNAGLGRSGSLDSAYRRNLEREIATYTVLA